MKKILFLLVFVYGTQLMQASDSTRFQAYFTFQLLGSRPVGVEPTAIDPFTIWEESETVRTKPGYQIGFGSCIHLNEKISISTGINYAVRGYLLNYEMGTAHEFQFDSLTRFVYDNKAKEGLRRKEIFLTIPMYLGYKIIQKTMLECTINIGISWNYQVKYCNVKLYEFAKVHECYYISEHPDYNAHSFMLEIGCALQFKNKFFKPILVPALGFSLHKRQHYLGKEAREMVYGLTILYPIKTKSE